MHRHFLSGGCFMGPLYPDELLFNFCEVIGHQAAGLADVPTANCFENPLVAV